ncbi:trigger factor [Oscillospiraceae bacterium MB08-C2-2]|nr:trigger factor [Oscillospiraceae bacterium MB08-C2-2]
MSLTSTQKTDNNIVELEIAVGAEEFKAAVDKAFRQKSKQLSVPGFRKGKAPRQIIEKMYGEGIFFDDAVNELYPAAYRSAVEEAGIEPVDKADVEILTLDKAVGFTFKATVTVKPEVEIEGYKGIAVNQVMYKATDAEVDQEIERMQDRNSRIIAVEGRPAQDGDTTVIDFEGFVDGVAFAGGKGEDHNLVLGSHQFIEGFEEQIIGKNVGDSFDVNVTFPEQYHAEELKGKPATFKVTLKELKEKELPELDDEFAKDVSEFDTLDELRADLRKKLQDARDDRSKDEVENALMDVVVENLKAEIPSVMIESRIDDMVRDFEYRISSQGLNMNMYLQYSGMDMAAFRAGFSAQAERQVKTRLALEKIAENEKLEASAEDIEAEYAKLAQQYNMKAEEIKNMLREKDVAADLCTTKALELIRSEAVITEVEEAAAETDSKETAKAPAKKAAAKKPAAKKAAAKKDEEAGEAK